MPDPKGGMEAGRAAHRVRAGSGVPALPFASRVTLGEPLRPALGFGFLTDFTQGFVRSKRGATESQTRSREPSTEQSLGLAFVLPTLGCQFLTAEIRFSSRGSLATCRCSGGKTFKDTSLEGRGRGRRAIVAAEILSETESPELGDSGSNLCGACPLQAEAGRGWGWAPPGGAGAS